MAGVPIDTERAGGLVASTFSELQSLPDEILLEQFLNRSEEEAQDAFQALVRRHGPMVLGVCRHILTQVHDAEDAFQATFLVLAQKAGSIRDGRVLGRWLYEVAYRIAVRSRTLAVRRRSHEARGAEIANLAPEVDAGGANDPAWNELRPVLHEEINRLPEKYRDAVVLCYLEGRTNEETAALLDWPVGTVKGRLFRARELLRSRLIRRGLVLSAALLALRLSQNTVFAEVVPSKLAEATARAAVRSSRGGVVLASTSRLATLVEEGLRTPRHLTAASRSAMGMAFVLLVLAAIVGGGLTALLRERETSFPTSSQGPVRPLVGRQTTAAALDESSSAATVAVGRCVRDE
ncbi:MAG: RNA polymerase sigma factor [Isosphaeraceae bacterium]